MKIRPSIILFAGIIVLLMVLVVWFGNNKFKTMMAVDFNTNEASFQASHTNEGGHLATQSLNRNAFASSNISDVTTSTFPTLISPDTKMGLSGLNDVPIVFYGRLEDQFGNPVASAQIAASVRIYNGTQSGVDRFSVASDANGYFQIDHGKGENLGLMPSKDGYVLVATNTAFKYSFMYQDHYTPNQNHPTVIKMWKLQGAEPLLGIDSRYKLYYTNAPLHFDLMAGKVVSSGGDLSLKVTRSAGVISGRNRLDWSVRVEAVGGGVMKYSEQEALILLAPESGYNSNEDLFFSTNAPFKWFGGFNQGFFLMSRNGQVYSKLGLTFRINDDPSGFIYITIIGAAKTNS